MEKHAQDFTCDIVKEMITLMRTEMHAEGNWEKIEPYYSKVITSIAASLLATIVIGWVESVTRNKEEAEDAFHHIMSDVANKVLFAFMTHNDDNKEIH